MGYDTGNVRGRGPPRACGQSESEQGPLAGRGPPRGSVRPGTPHARTTRAGALSHPSPGRGVSAAPSFFEPARRRHLVETRVLQRAFFVHVTANKTSALTNPRLSHQTERLFVESQNSNDKTTSTSNTHATEQKQDDLGTTCVWSRPGAAVTARATVHPGQRRSGLRDNEPAAGHPQTEPSLCFRRE